MKQIFFVFFLSIVICGNAVAQQQQPEQPEKVAILFTFIETEEALWDAVTANPNSIVLFGLPKVANPETEVQKGWNRVNERVEDVKAFLGAHEVDKAWEFFYFESKWGDEVVAKRFRTLAMAFTQQSGDAVKLPAMAIIQNAKPSVPGQPGHPIKQFVKATFIGVENCKEEFLIRLGVKQRSQPEQEVRSDPEPEPKQPEVQVINFEKEMWRVIESGAPSYLIFCRMYEAPCTNIKIAFKLMTTRPVDIPVYIVDLRRPDGYTRDLRHEFWIEKQFIPQGEAGSIVNDPVVGVLTSGFKAGMQPPQFIQFRLAGDDAREKFTEAVAQWRNPSESDVIPLVPLTL